MRLTREMFVLPEGIKPIPDDDPRAIAFRENMKKFIEHMETGCAEEIENIRIARAKSWELAQRTVIG